MQRALTHESNIVALFKLTRLPFLEKSLPFLEKRHFELVPHLLLLQVEGDHGLLDAWEYGQAAISPSPSPTTYTSLSLSRAQRSRNKESVEVRAFVSYA